MTFPDEETWEGPPPSLDEIQERARNYKPLIKSERVMSGFLLCVGIFLIFTALDVPGNNSFAAAAIVIWALGGKDR